MTAASLLRSVPLLAMVACTTGTSGPAGGSELTLFPNQLYTGLDEAMTYSVPVAPGEVTGVTWSTASPAVATARGDDTFGLVTGVAPGSTMVIASAGGQTASVAVTVIRYTASDRMAGQAAFTANNCASSACHAPGSGLDIGPTDIGKHTDAQIQAAVTMGMNPEGGELEPGKAAHSFAIAAGSPAYAGIVAYLRSMAPAGAPRNDD